MLSYGFGTSSVATLQFMPLQDNGDNFIIQTLAANSFQVGLTLLYFLTNGFITTICIQHEWSSYARNRKGLRVSTTRRGEQRSTYFFQIPFRFSVPLIAIFAVLHWLVSETFFVVDEAVKLSETNEILQSSTHLGFSPLAACVALVLLAVMLLYIIVQGLWIIRLPMPALRTCSAVLAAACHPDQGGRASEIYLEQVRWGTECDINNSFSPNVRHCGFSAGYVDMPEEGRMYA